jgi:hypothetical protein
MEVYLNSPIRLRDAVFGYARRTTVPCTCNANTSAYISVTSHLPTSSSVVKCSFHFLTVHTPLFTCVLTRHRRFITGQSSLVINFLLFQFPFFFVRFNGRQSKFCYSFTFYVTLQRDELYKTNIIVCTARRSASCR